MYGLIVLHVCLYYDAAYIGLVLMCDHMGVNLLVFTRLRMVSIVSMVNRMQPIWKALNAANVITISMHMDVSGGQMCT